MVQVAQAFYTLLSGVRQKRFIMDDTALRLTLAVIVAMIAAMLLSMRSMIVMERRIGRIEQHIEKLVGKTLREEYKIEKKMRKR